MAKRKTALITNLVLVFVILLVPISALSEVTLKVGDVAPSFVLPNEAGESVSLDQFQGKVVVLEWINPDCPYVKRHYKASTMRSLAEKYSAKVAWIAVNSTHYMEATRNAEWKKEHQLSYPILRDADGAVGRSYGAKTTPHMFVISPEGKIAYQGAIDDDPYGDKSVPENYVDKSLDELLAGKQLSSAETAPYGCSVKYAKG